MLTPEKELSCGIFDSSILRKNQSKSQNRTVTCYELEIFHSATGTSHMNDESHKVKRGMLLCAKPGAVRRSDFPVRCGFIRITAEGAEREGIAMLLSSLASYTYIENTEEADEIIALFSKLGQRLFESSTEPLNTIRANALFLDIVCRLHRICGKASETRISKPAGDMIHAAREYINEHFTESCSLNHIADAVNVSPNYLHTSFKEAFGETPYGYVTRKRIEKAKRLIMAGQASMLDIALETGFCSQSHFNKVFKSQTGVTPKQFRDSFVDEY